MTNHTPHRSPDGDPGDDIISGAKAIALFLFGDERRRGYVYYLCDRGDLPHFRLTGDKGRIYCRKSLLRAWLEKRGGGE